MKLDGPELLQQVFHKYNVHSWGMFGTLIGYVFFFRFIQYLLFAFQTGVLTFPSTEQQAAASSTEPAKPAYQAVPAQDQKAASGPAALEIGTNDSKV
jgi:hypothetical protein